MSTVGYKSKLTGRAGKSDMSSGLMSVASVFDSVPGHGSCFKCSTLTDKTGLCQVN